MESPDVCGERKSSASRLVDAELLFCVGAEAFGSPGRSPDHIDFGVADTGQLLEARLYLGADVDVLGAALRGEGKVDGDVLFRFFGTLGGRSSELDGVNEAEVDDVDGDLGVVATFQSA